MPADKAQVQASGGPAVDWELVERDYRAGLKTTRQIGEEHGVSHTAVQKRAKKGGWSRDVARASRIERSISVTAIDDEDRKFCTPGFIYVVYFTVAGENFYKIGLASHLDSRLRSHQGSNPFEVRIAVAYYVDNMRREEAALHGQFQDKQIRGEWYRLDRADLEFIASRSLLLA